ncbi:hypothetical protein QN379_22460 [Glaciimonas sp. Gout2]|uniref:hypothetical protein n=1 Tax=unclassified Glaciimonas TaxID=2644401 RepID=UPI002B224A90|nr:MULTISPECIES: hypothetical protein [unclassified Glaciimonas]MEB0010310.1 hypothetical protein [Glaciimonas sp. Cout2]MEB0084775.1 hypothetical protein [Glaciimonas sp. Gout2]
MPKIIQTMCEVMPEEGVLVRSGYLRNNIKASALMNEARRRAKSLVAHAEAEVEYIYQQAQCDGYAKGILQAAGELVQYLAGHADLGVEMITRLREEIRVLLYRSVVNPEVVMAIFEESLDREDVTESTSLNLLIPESFRPNHRTLMEHFRLHFKGHINIEYQFGTRFLLRMNDHVAEFSPDEFVNMASDRAMNSLPAIHLQSNAIMEVCRERLAVIFDTHCSPPIALQKCDEGYD